MASPKNLIVCTDGTWNRVEKFENGVRVSTNVARVAAFLETSDSQGSEQRICYIEGVGTHDGDSFSGGAFGWGLSANVEAAYRFLVNNFAPGDRLYFFGFSRGAFTVRSLAALVRNCGIVRRDDPQRIDEALSLYRDRRDSSDSTSIRARVFRKQYSNETKIRFVGVWDTVGALGSPLLKHSFARWLGWDWRFHDATLGPHIEHAAHAVAMHETRSNFLPTLWKHAEDAPDTQILEQVWFAGCHSDVGGGYSDSGLSDIALEWMIHRATVAGAAFQKDWKKKKLGTGQTFAPSPIATIHNETKGFWAWMEVMKGRPLGVSRNPFFGEAAGGRRGEVGRFRSGLAKLATMFRRRAPIVGKRKPTAVAIHQSVVERFAKQQQGDWWPEEFIPFLNREK